MEFSNDWFQAHVPAWTALFARFVPNPRRILEIGSFEGQSACWMIRHAFGPAGGELVCLDTWQGGAEHAGTDMGAVERRFLANIAEARAANPAVTVTPLKATSRDGMVSLLAQGAAGSFDVVYVDGSHMAADVLADLVLGFALCRVEGIIICDDYLWSCDPPGRENPLHDPKLAIDAFVNCHRQKLAVIRELPPSQVAMVKRRD